MMVVLLTHAHQRWNSQEPCLTFLKGTRGTIGNTEKALISSFYTTCFQVSQQFHINHYLKKEHLTSLI